ncbi:Zn-dependent peptidase ImmA (M78 family)/transcriptional regulator with XRE-family HTH domain [Streptacidiphilus sp. MAP12-16]|uniref:helix-turn-helix domain-containing protein n=1 Tax=Streptacidiphilus sp. MAP12-16 TaxID=3156300 RepID=UPI0035116410
MDETVSGRVRAVIHAASLSQAAFADHVGLSPDKLSKSLSGIRRFTSLELALIAEAGQVTVDWLLTGKEPLRPALAARTSTAIAAGRDGIAEVTDRFTSAYDVLDLLGRSPALPALPSVGTDPPGNLDQGAALADAARELLTSAGAGTIAEQSTDDLLASWERAFGVDIAITRLPSGVDGLAWQADHFRLILVNRTDRWTRQRFTVAHELGHLLARDAQDVLLEAEVAPGRQTEASEIRANSFAANLLLPEDELRAAFNATDRTDDSFSRLVVRYRVSPSALAARLKALGLIDQPARDRLRRLTTADCHASAGSMRDYLQQATQAERERFPLRLAGGLYSGYREGDTTLRPLAALLQTDVDDLLDLLEPPTPDLPNDVSAFEGDMVFQP